MRCGTVPIAARGLRCRVFQVGFDSSGRISSLQVQSTINGGWTVDLSWFTNFSLPGMLSVAQH